MLCVTGRETSSEALLERLRAVEERLEGTEHLQEVRLDYLTEPEAAARRLGPWSSRLLVTCRPRRQGGAYVGSEGDRLDLLKRASSIGPCWLDIEADVPQKELDGLRTSGARNILASWHLWESEEGDIPAAAERLRAQDVDLRKLAVAVSDAAELAELRTLSSPGRPLFTIGMGAAGTLSRCRYPAFGATWTYVSTGAEAATAPGQMTLDQALRWGLPEAAEHPFLALLGGPQIAHSPGPACYNHLFRRLERPWSYLPVVTTRGRDSLALVRDLGAMGAAVTMPNKDAAREFAHPDRVVERVGAANSVRFDAPPVSTNTDVEGVRGPLSRAIDRVGETLPAALVLGAGGAARAAVQACRDLGLDVLVSARRSEAAEALVGSTDTVPWADRTSPRSSVLINATSVGGRNGPWPPHVALNKAIVFDMTLDPAPSGLLVQAREEGAVTVDGLTMWLEQGAAQTRFLTGLTVSTNDLKDALS